MGHAGGGVEITVEWFSFWMDSFDGGGGGLLMVIPWKEEGLNNGAERG
jgi:hypothetical protein